MSFRLKTVLGIALIELTVMVILIGINQFALGGSAATQLYERAESTARVFSNAVADAVIATDLATLDATVHTAVSGEELSYLRILTPSGVVLSQDGAEAALAKPFSRDASFESARADHIIDLDLPIVVEGVTFGVVELGLSTLKVEAQLANALQWNLIIALLGMTLVALFGFGLGSVLTRQLHWLRQGARAIAGGDLGRQIRVKGRDELAETAECFNEMAKTLAQDRAVLQDQRSELLAKKDRVEILVHCLTDIARGGSTVTVPDTERPDEIGDMARATQVFQQTMQALEQAHYEQQRLISAFDQLDEQVAIFATNGRVMFLNKSFRNFNQSILEHLPTDFTLEDFLRQGCTLGEFEGVAGEDEAWIQEQMGREFGTPREMRRRPARVLLTMQSNAPGIGVVWSGKDITELRESEGKLIQASKLATLGEMATGIAHELNQPLGVIRMASNNCVKRIDRDKADLEYLRTKLVRMGEQTERASQIINHMRVFGRKAEGLMEPFDLRGSLLEMSSLARAQLQTLDISLMVSVPDEPALVVGEQVIFQQVLLNLISNARDAIVSSGAKSGKIELQAQFDTAEGHVISVQDTGGGIPHAILDKLFEPFFTTKDPGKGTGLGLSISFGTIRDMSGHISVSNTDEGACFKVTLPQADTACIGLEQTA